MQNGMSDNCNQTQDPNQAGYWVLSESGMSRVNTQGLIDWYSKEHKLDPEAVKVLIEHYKVYKVDKLSLIREKGEVVGTPEKTDLTVKTPYQTPYTESYIVSPRIMRNLHK